MSEVTAGLRSVLWSEAEGRLRAPWRLALGSGAVLVLADAVSMAALALAQLGAGLGPTLGATWVVVVATLALGSVLAGVLAVVRLVDRRPLRDLGLVRSPTVASEAVTGAVVGVGMAVAVVAAAAALGLASVAGVLTTWDGTLGLVATHGVLTVAFWLVVLLAVGCVEEVLLRGFVLVDVAEGVRGQTGSATQATLVGVVAAAGVSGVLHAVDARVSLVGVATAVAVGLLLGWTVAVTGRVALAVGLRVAWYATLGLGLGLPVAGLDTGVALLDVDLVGPPLLTGGQFGPPGGLLAVAGLVVGTGALGWWLARTRGLAFETGVAVPAERGPGRQPVEGDREGHGGGSGGEGD